MSRGRDRDGGEDRTDSAGEPPSFSATQAEELDRACDQFEAAWRAGGEPRIEDHLGQTEGPLRSALLGELIAIEIDWRGRRGEHPGPAEYLDRFPQNPDAVRAAFGVKSRLAPPTSGGVPPRPGPGTGWRAEAANGLLLGLLALQNNLIDRESLLTALGVWVADKSIPLGQILTDRRAIDAEARTLLETLARRHLATHGDAEKSLAALSLGRSTRESLAKLDDGDLQATLTHVGSSANDDDRDPAQPLAYNVGTASSAGQRFRVLRPHARGGLGAVFVALDSELNREVALKQILDHYADDPVRRQRFLIEAEITGKLEHPGIVPVYGLGTYDDGRPYYAMRFIRGDSLKEAIERYHSDELLKTDLGLRSLELRKLLRRFLDVCNAIEYAHSRGVLHRDLKPGNIIIGRHGETLVVDWGLAKPLGRPEPEPGSSAGERPLVSTPVTDNAETLPGATLGTPSYMSPEQAAGDLDRIGPPSDIYGLGATLYCLLTGRPPFQGNKSDVVRKVREGDFVLPRKVDTSIDPALEAVCLKAMALKAEARYPTLKALADDIERWAADEPVSVYREPWPRRLARFAKRHRQAFQVAAALLASVIVSLAAATRVDRVQRINRLLRDTGRGLETSDWSPATLASLEAKAAALEQLDRAQGLEARQRIRQSFARAINELMDRTPKLEPAIVARLEADLNALQARSPELATALRKNLELRLGRAETTTLSAPFPQGDLAAFFDPGQVRIEGNGLIRAPRPGQPFEPTLAVRLDSQGDARLAATFHDSWSESSAVGLVLKARGGDRYQFLVAVPGYTSPGPGEEDGHRPTTATLKTVARSGGRLLVLILRNQVPLAQTTISPPNGPLRLEAGREADLLSFQVNAERPLTCEDPFPLGGGATRRFGLFWPARVTLQGLILQRRRLPARPTPLERGDELYDRGEFTAALMAYQERGLGPADGPIREELRFKRALCLLELNQADKAERLLVTVMAGMDDSRAGGPDRWPLRAACRLWRLRLEQNKGTEADQILEKLTPTYRFEQLAVLISARERDSILARYRQADIWGTVAWHTRYDRKHIERAMRVQDLLNLDDHDRRMTKWRLIDILRIDGDTEAALKGIRELLDHPALPASERVELLRDFVWIRINQGEPGAREALDQINHWLAVNPTGREYLPLLTERARIEGALGRWPEAEKDCELFFAEIPRDRLHYAEFADACLVRGFVRDQRGDHDGALAAWREGLIRNWPPGIPDLLPYASFDRVALRRRSDAVAWGVMLASLTGELSEDEAGRFFDVVSGGDASDRAQADGGDLVRIFRKLGLVSRYVRQIMLDEFRRPLEIEYARNAVFRRVSLRDFIVVGLEIGVTSGVRVGAFPDGVPAALEDTLRDAVKGLFRAYDEGTIRDDDAVVLVRLWFSLTLSPASLWKGPASHLDPRIRGPIAYGLGRRFLTLGQPRTAAFLFQDALDHVAEDHVLRPFLREELGRLQLQPAENRP